MKAAPEASSMQTWTYSQPTSRELLRSVLSPVAHPLEAAEALDIEVDHAASLLT